MRWKDALETQKWELTADVAVELRKAYGVGEVLVFRLHWRTTEISTSGAFDCRLICRSDVAVQGSCSLTSICMHKS